MPEKSTGWRNKSRQNKIFIKLQAKVMIISLAVQQTRKSKREQLVQFIVKNLNWPRESFFTSKRKIVKRRHLRDLDLENQIYKRHL